MRIRLAIPDHLVTPAVIEAALEATTLANEQAIKRGDVPTLREAIADGVKWQPEPFIDGEHFDLMGQVVRRGWGDCDDLAPALAAEMRASGEDVGARPRIYQTGKKRYHAVVETSDGEILDPSRWAGMGRRKSTNVRGVSGAIAKPFAHSHQGALCVMPGNGKWWARADLPWANAMGHIASHARASTPDKALERAISGALDCGEVLEPSMVERMREIGTTMLTDADVVCGDDSEIGNAFQSILKGAGGALPIPGLGMATSLLSSLTGSKLNFQGRVPSRETFQKGLSKVPSYLRGKMSAEYEKLIQAQDATDRQQGAQAAIPMTSTSPTAQAPSPMTLYYHPAGSIGPVVMRF